MQSFVSSKRYGAIFIYKSSSNILEKRFSVLLPCKTNYRYRNPRQWGPSRDRKTQRKNSKITDRWEYQWLANYPYTCKFKAYPSRIRPLNAPSKVLYWPLEIAWEAKNDSFVTLFLNLYVGQWAIYSVIFTCKFEIDMWSWWNKQTNYN